ncbi:thiamine phosphate synthase [Pelobacter propionicus]|uniref:Thiamine-phosphate synthase n=1 Tax=Pelobacter propionicus (strain DSM 2379 / NBRC 103807 / OttBd1) TaxID=338966 RepID=A1AUP8_PELPD|nr:thiamine phosphate synthase [Pelobacter propionicus]ABL01069.1 thiamine-phosphate diphosphorylase [Pelobacter propionicus DSM 2379]
MSTVSRGEGQSRCVDFSLYLITDRRQTAGRPLLDVVAAALRGGVGAVQLREKDLPDNELLELARDLRRLTHEHHARLLINRRVDVCQAVGADGVQLGIEGLSIVEARRLLGDGPLIGYSAHAVEEARRAEASGADFVTLSPVYHTPSKAPFGEPLGPDRLGEACGALGIPVFALGGIKGSTIARVMAAGAHGVALISAITAAANPETEAASLLQTIEQHETLS